MSTGRFSAHRSRRIAGGPPEPSPLPLNYGRRCIQTVVRPASGVKLWRIGIVSSSYAAERRHASFGQAEALMALSHTTEQLRSADFLTLTAFVPSASRIGTGTAMDAVCRMYETCRPLAATMTLASEGFGRSGRVYSDRTEVLSFSMPIAVSFVDRPSRVLPWLRSLTELLPGRLVLLRALWTSTVEQQQPSAIQPMWIMGDRRRPDQCAGLIDRLHAHGLWAAWAFTDFTPRRWWSAFGILPVTVVDEQRRLARAMDPDVMARYGDRTLVGAYAMRSGATAVTARQLGECCLVPWMRITFLSPKHTCGGAARHRRAIHAMRAAGGTGATTFAASCGYLRPARPQRPRRARVGRHTPIVTTIATDERLLDLCMNVLQESATAQDLITCEPVSRVVPPHD